MSNIFAETAPPFWAAGLPVIPLRPVHKAPIPSGWQNFCSQMPEPDTQKAWLQRYPDSNIGLALGPCSGLVAIDLDTDDPKITQIIEDLLPKTPWVRRGAKGAVYLYKSPASHEHRTFRIRTIEGKSLVECLAKGTQIVLPPSIHPDTQKPYVATAFLPDVLALLPVLPRDIETIIRGALSEEGITLSTRGSAKMVEWVAAGNRDSALTSIAGLLARAVIRGERNLAEAFGEIETWIANFTEKVVGDEVSPQKGRQKIVEFIKRDLFEGKRNLPTGWDEGLSEQEKEAAAKEFGEDNEEWTVERCMEHIDNQFELHDRNSAGRRKAIQEVLGRISKSSMDELDKEAVLTYIAGCSSRAITLSALRRQLKGLEQGEIEGTDHTEIAQALHADLARFGDIRLHGDRLWQWVGSHWIELPETRVLETIAREFGSLPAAKRHSDHKGIYQILRNLVQAGLKDSTLVGINFANGYLTSDLVLHPHDPKHGCTYVLPYCYDAGLSTAPQRFFSFLYQSWGGDPDYKDKVKALREAIAVTMFNQASMYQRVFCLIGRPWSGKSQLQDILIGLMPYNSVCNVRPHDWKDKFLPAQMHNKLLNYCGELSDTDLIDGASFKSIVDGTEMQAQHKNRPIFQFKPTCAHWFNSNHMPRSRDSSKGFTRRWLFLRFNKAVPREERIPALAFEILSEEREAIAAWAVQAMPELIANRDFTLPQSHTDIEKEMEGINNSVQAFLRSCRRVSLVKKGGKQGRCSEEELHQAYWTYTVTVARGQAVQLRLFRSRMRDLLEEFGLQLVFDRTPSGAEAAFYDNITLI